MSKDIDWTVCRTCSNCCKKSGVFISSEDDAKRFSWLKTDKIYVETIAKNLWRIVFDFPCKQLGLKAGLYFCKIYKERPNCCRIYPKDYFDPNVPKGVQSVHIEQCPILKDNFRKELENDVM